MPVIPARPLFPGTFFTSHSIVSYVSVPSSISFEAAPLDVLTGRCITNCPSDLYRPRMSWNTKKYPSYARSANPRLRASAAQSHPYGERSIRKGSASVRFLGENTVVWRWMPSRIGIMYSWLVYSSAIDAEEAASRANVTSPLVSHCVNLPVISLPDGEIVPSKCIPADFTSNAILPSAKLIGPVSDASPDSRLISAPVYPAATRGAT